MLHEKSPVAVQPASPIQGQSPLLSNLINREKNRERNLAKAQNRRKSPCFHKFSTIPQKITGKDQGENREDRGKNRE